MRKGQRILAKVKENMERLVKEYSLINTDAPTLLPVVKINSGEK
jgi:hypothetical protein